MYSAGLSAGKIWQVEQKKNKKDKSAKTAGEGGGVVELKKKPSFEFMLGVGGKIVYDSLKIVTVPFTISYVYVYTGKWQGTKNTISVNL